MRHSFCLTVILLVMAAAAFGQSRQVTMPVAQPVTFEILEQQGCPLSINLDEKIAERIPGPIVKITNTGSSTVMSFVVRIKRSDFEVVHTTVFFSKPLEPEKFMIHMLSGVRSVRDGDGNAVVSIDYVEFADGTKWGADSLGRSKQIAEYRRGRASAIERLKELLSGQEATDFLKATDKLTSAGFSEPIMPAGRAPRNLDCFSSGYGQIIMLLRTTRTRPDEAKELARKLELMESAARQ